MRYARQCLAEAMLIPLKDNRKVTLVTDSVDYYAEMIKFKNEISAVDGASKKNLLAVCAVFMQCTGYLRCDQSLYRLYFLCNG